VEVISNGTRQGASTKRLPGQALKANARSRLCKLSFFIEASTLITAYARPHTIGSISSDVTLLLYSSEEKPAQTYFQAKQSAVSYQEAKAALRQGALKGWLVSGEPFESFDSAGVNVENVLQST
jgi:hypothetical protein